MRTEIDLAFADGEYRFFLGLPQINEIETKCGCGIGALFARVWQGRLEFDDGPIALPQGAAFKIVDIYEVIRQGLLGGGRGTVDGQEVKVDSSVVSRLMANYVMGEPVMPLWDIAASVLSACIIGYEPPKKAEPAKERAKPKRTED